MGITDEIEALERGDTVDSPPTLSFTSYDDLMETLTPRVLDLIEVIRREEPASINETVRVVDQDVKTSTGSSVGSPSWASSSSEKTGSGSAWFDELTITLPFDSGANDTATTAP